jgi:hypothetical protein
LTFKQGGCACLDGECVTRHCRYIADVTPVIPAGGSISHLLNCVNAGNPAPQQQVSVTLCGRSSSMQVVAYTAPNCVGTSAYWTYFVMCASTKCGDYKCN